MAVAGPTLCFTGERGPVALTGQRVIGIAIMSDVWVTRGPVQVTDRSKNSYKDVWVTRG